MTIQELETQVSTLNPADKAKLISILTQTLTNGSLGDISENSQSLCVVKL